MSGIDYQRLRAQLAMEDILRWMSWEPTEKRGDQLRGPCPLCGQPGDRSASSETASSPRALDQRPLPHADHKESARNVDGQDSARRRYFSVHVRRKLFHCFRCQQGGNALELWAKYRGIIIAAAAKEIRDRLPETQQTQIKQPQFQTKPTS